MNTFKKNNKESTFLICKTGEIKATELVSEIRKKLADKQSHETYNLVYIYYLIDEKIKYPKADQMLFIQVKPEDKYVTTKDQRLAGLFILKKGEIIGKI